MGSSINNYKVALFSGDSKLQQIILDQLYATDRNVYLRQRTLNMYFRLSTVLHF